MFFEHGNSEGDMFSSHPFYEFFVGVFGVPVMGEGVF